jgi:hypothetical protein
LWTKGGSKEKNKAGFKLDFSQETDGEKKMKIQW